MPLGRHDDYTINTIIGPNSNLKGNIDTPGFTRIDGSITGDVNASGRVVIGERARMKSNVLGTAVTIGGVVYGNVIAGESLVVLSTALVLGDIITRRIKADEGCLIHGRIKVCPDEESWASAVSEYRDAQKVKSALPVFAKKTGKDDVPSKDGIPSRDGGPSRDGSPTKDGGSKGGTAKDKAPPRGEASLRGEV